MDDASNLINYKHDFKFQILDIITHYTTK
jgi:hypothetical protein